MSFLRPKPKNDAATASEDDVQRALVLSQSRPGSMPYLHDIVSLHALAELFGGDRDRAIRAVDVLIERGEVRFLENCSPPHYQAWRAIPACPAATS